jgi:hypothetical protein
MTATLIRKLNAACEARRGEDCQKESCLLIGWCDGVWLDVLSLYQDDKIQGKIGNEGMRRHGTERQDAQGAQDQIRDAR